MTRFILPLLLIAVTADAAEPPEFQLVESWPVETEGLEMADMPDAHTEWLDMIKRAREEICVAAFYLSDDPDDDEDRLDQVLDALTAAGARGVRVRVLSDKGFHRTYPEWPDRFATLPGCESRLLDARGLWGGVLHAKYMVVDGRECFVGSQNWDWRALTHIRELGVRLRHAELSTALRHIFDLDWALAGDEEPPLGGTAAAGPFELTTDELGPVTVTMTASPPKALPDGMGHDLAPLQALIDGAKESLVLQVLSYHPSNRDGSEYLELDTALRRAAARGVDVRLVVSNWAKRPSQLPWLKSLTCVPGIEVRFSNIPAWSGGYVPFGRVEHPKYLVADGCAAWVGTSNWGPGYFSDSRNISVFIEGEGVARQLLRYFEAGWTSDYSETVDPGRHDYQAPRREE